MTTQQIRVANRLGKNMVLFIDAPTGAETGLAFVLHGYTGCAEELHIAGMAAALNKHGYRTVRVDATNSFNRAEGLVEDCTPTTHLHDLEDAIAWTRGQDWFQEPFVLAGHSLGALAVAVYAQTHPQSVAAVAPCATVVSGRLRIEWNEQQNPDTIAAMKRDGFVQVESFRAYGPRTGKRTWAHLQDNLKYDLLPLAPSMPMPVGLFVAKDDTATPLAHQQMLYDALPADTRSLAVFETGEHCYLNEGLQPFLDAFDAWVKGLK